MTFTAVVFLLVGAPALTGWALEDSYSRRVLDRQPELRRRVVMDHRLTPEEVRPVERAVVLGRRMTGARLRAAAVEWARAYEAADPGTSGAAGRRFAWLTATGLLVLAVVAAVRGRWSGVPTTWTAELVLLGLWLEHGRRRAAERNSDPVAPA